MKRLFLGIAALALLLVTTESASAQGFGISYGTRVGNSGFLSVGYGTGWGGYGYGYPAYGYGYAAPVYGYSYAAPVYAAPVYGYSYAAPVYYSGPSFGVSYSRGWGGGWG